jgi:hypothetical protein
VLLIVIGLAVFGLFLVAVGPLFTGSGSLSAEIAAVLPTRALAGQPLEVDMAYDNTGSALISPVCVGVEVSGPLQPQYALFLSVDRVQFAHGSVCGGSLGGGETVSIRLFLTATGPGTARYGLTPRQGGTPVGRAVAASVVIAPR